jgi:hypothetical protein
MKTETNFTDVLPIADPALKGKLGGNCNRAACQQPGALYFNQSTKMYYCKLCASTINRHADVLDCLRLFGTHDLCIWFDAVKK